MPPNDSRSDEELIAAANAGDASAFDALYARYRDWVLRVAYRYTCNQDDALDVLQEVFLYLLGKFPGFKLTARLTTFLYPAIRNCALAQRRKRRHTEPIPADLAEPPGPAPAEELSNLLNALPEPQREILLMRFVDDMTTTEIAAALQIPVGTAKSRLHAAVNHLRNHPRTRDYFKG